MSQKDHNDKVGLTGFVLDQRDALQKENVRLRLDLAQARETLKRVWREGVCAGKLKDLVADTLESTNVKTDEESEL